MSGPSAGVVVAALQAALAAENAAIYGYGVAGGQLAGGQLARAQLAWDSHQQARDTLTGLITAHGGRAAVAAVSYRLPFPASDPARALALLAYLEDRVATAYLGLVALTAPPLRDLGARQVTAAALRAAAWRGGTVAFPGLSG